MVGAMSEETVERSLLIIVPTACDRPQWSCKSGLHGGVRNSLYPARPDVYLRPPLAGLVTGPLAAEDRPGETVDRATSVTRTLA
jgi:hypothetical protein